MTQQKHTAEFESCIQQVMEQGHEKESAFAICTDAFKKAGKPIFTSESEKQKLHLFNESFKLKGNKVSGVAIHPKKIFHPEEGLTHVYFREELEKAAPTLIGKPFGIDHQYVLPPPNVVTKAWYCPEHEGICFEGTVDDKIAKDIRQKAFKGISIELNWLRPSGSVEYVNGVAARNFALTSVHFLKKFPPGDPEAFVTLWEQMKEQLVMGPPLPLDQRVEALETQIQEILNQINVINAKLEVLTGSSQPSPPLISQIPSSPLRLKNPWKIGEVKEVKFEVAPEPTMDELIESVEDALERINSAIEQINQNFAALEAKVKALENAEKQGQMQEQQGQEEENYQTFMAQCLERGKTTEECVAAWKQKQGGQTQSAKTESIVALRKKLAETEVKLADVQKHKLETEIFWREQYTRLYETVKGKIPSMHIWKAWRPGCQMLVQELLKVLREFQLPELESQS